MKQKIDCIELNESVDDMHGKHTHHLDMLECLSIKAVFLAVETDSQYFQDGDLKAALRREFKRFIDTFKDDESYYMDLMTKFIEVSK